MEQSESSVATKLTDDERRYAWRVLQAGILGLEWIDAVRVADSGIDLHELARLIEAGCPPPTAVEILI